MSVEIIKLNKELMRGPEPILAPTSNTWICGGAIRQWFLGTEKKSDIDVFGASPEELDIFVKYKLGDSPLISENKYTKTYDYKGQWVQVIFGKPYPSITEAFDSFDFNVCQFAYDGQDIYSTVSAVTSVLRGHLSVHNISVDFAADSLRRAFKYAEKGYKPCAGTIQKLGESFIGLTKEKLESQVQISPGGGKRLYRID